MKTVRVVFSPEAEEAYNCLNQGARHGKAGQAVLRSINQKIELIKSNPHYGNPMAKNLIPKECRQKYGINNLFRVELSNYWGMLYSLADGETKIEIIAFVLDLMDHKHYNKRFGYKTK